MTIYKVTGDRAEAVEPEIMSEVGTRAHIMFHALITFVNAFSAYSVLEMIVIFKSMARVYQDIADSALKDGLKSKGPFALPMAVVLRAWLEERAKWEAENPQHVAMREACRTGADEKPRN